MEADKVRSYDSHIPEHLRPKVSTSFVNETFLAMLTVQ